MEDHIGALDLGQHPFTVMQHGDAGLMLTVTKDGSDYPMWKINRRNWEIAAWEVCGLPTPTQCLGEIAVAHDEITAITVPHWYDAP